MRPFKRKGSPHYWIKFQLNGVRVYESTKTTNKKLAEKILLDKRTEILTGRVLEKPEAINKSIGFKELVERYLGFIEGRLKSFKELKYIAKILIAYFKDKPLNGFNIMDAELVQKDAIKKGLSVRTANYYTRILTTMFRKAAEWELVDESVVKKLARCKKIKGENKRLRYLTEEEAERLIECCEPTYLKPIVVMALNTGMRIGEILKLTWPRVDIKNGIILLDKTKNGERREIPVNETLRRTLATLLRHIKTDYLFYNPNTLLPYDRLKNSWKTACKRAHIMDFHFHDLRHTFASWLVMRGVDLTTVKEILGHKDIGMTLRYAHLAPSHIKRAVEILDERCKIVAVNQDQEIQNP